MFSDAIAAGKAGYPPRVVRDALLLLLLVLALLSCGSRSSLDVLGEATAAPGGGSPGAGGSTSSAGGSTSSAGGQEAGCEALLLVEPVIAAPTPSLARAPGIGLLPPENDVFLSFVEAPPDTPGLLRAGRIDPFAAWPPDGVALAELDADVVEYAVGPGFAGPVALLRHGAGDPSFLATTFLPQIEGVPLGAGNDRASTRPRPRS